MLKMSNVTKVYRAHLIETRALWNFCLEVERGEFVAITGPSGSGKSTFLNVAGLLDTFDSGTYELDGTDVSKLSDREMSRVRNQKIGFIFQSFNLIPDLDVFDNVDVPLRYRGMPSAVRRERIETALAQVGLSARAKHYPSQLSGGQQQRVAIARVLANDPRLILADEPTGNLDSTMAREIMNLLADVNDRGVTIVMVTHNSECAARAGRQLHIFDGRLAEIEPAVLPAMARPLARAAAV